jgi:hypothetical protein
MAAPDLLPRAMYGSGGASSSQLTGEGERRQLENWYDYYSMLCMIEQADYALGSVHIAANHPSQRSYRGSNTASALGSWQRSSVTMNLEAESGIGLFPFNFPHKILMEPRRLLRSRGNGILIVARCQRNPCT